MLKQYIDKVQNEFWKESWERFSIEELTQGLERTDLWKIFRRYLPEKGKILEGGCGLGHWVKFLKEKGYDTIGVERDSQTVIKGKTEVSDLPVFEGDVTSLNFPGSYFDAYLSLGVIEHFEEGPRKILEEAKRVLKPRGVFLVSVPFLSLAKRIMILKISLLKRDNLGCKEFYQYTFSKSEFRKILENYRFKVKYIKYCSIEGGIERRIRVITKLKKSIRSSESTLLKKVSPHLHDIWDGIIKLIPGDIFAHMILAVCESEK
ncbi:hypothetical protein ES707_22731 [subsurface metagenome]